MHFERFPPETVSKLYARRTGSYRLLKRIASITHELDISWDPGISPIFSGENSTLSDACAFLGLSSIAADPSQRLSSTSTTLVQT